MSDGAVPPRFLAAVPAMPVSDMDRATAFYTGALGMTVAHREARFAILTRDRVELHLWGATDGDWRGRPGFHAQPVETGAETFIAGTASCRIAVEGLDALHDACADAGVIHPNGPLAEKPWGTREFATLDPDGNLVTLYERLAR
ncbi:MAG: bleomycin resistance protein [Paracoccaceae bacterium]